MQKLLRTFVVLVLVAFSAHAEGATVIATSKNYVDSGLAQKASAAIVDALNQNITSFQNRAEGFATAAQGTNANAAKIITDSITANNTIVKANNAVATGDNVSKLNNDAGYITATAISGKEDTVNKKQTITNSATDYPSGAAVYSHTSNISNPHNVTKAQIDLGNVKNVDQTNASNLTSGTVAYGRLPVGTTANTIAAGDDSRFNTIPTSAPSGAAPSGRVFIWFEP